MRKILVTGAAGFVGRHLTHALLEAGHLVYAVDGLVPLTGARDPKHGWPFCTPFDFRNFKFFHEDCREWFIKNKADDFDYAYHAAALVGGRLMIENNPLAVAEDLAIDAAFWNWAKDVRPKKSICFSSSAAYPISLQRKDHFVLLKETFINFKESIGIPDMTYGWAKLTSEYLARLAYEKYGLSTISFRPFSGYGEDQDDAYPFPSICKRVVANRGAENIMVWGSGYQMRDFIHIDDCVEGILSMVDKIDDGDAVNLSTGKLTSFRELASMASRALGLNHKVLGSTNLPEGVFARGGDIQKQIELGFKAKIDLQRGINRAIKFLT
jgi:nucleoside-diphosphate-sugar epimerase